MDKNIIYLDNASTTRPFDEVLETYEKANKEYFGNPSSIHFFGVESSNLFSKAKAQIQKYLKVEDYDLIYTSGATESINLAIMGYCLKNQNRGKHIITSVYEHPAVLESIKQLQDFYGFSITYLSIDNSGHISLDELQKAIKNDTILVSIMAVNNEIGSINNIKGIKEITSKYSKVCFFSDTTQAIGKIALDYSCLDMFVVSGHKIHGLKGTGCLLKRKNINLLPLNNGGGQQDGIRSGTIDVPGALSLAKAIRLNYESISDNFKKVSNFRDKISSFLKENHDKYEINSSFENPYIINFSTKHVKSSVVVEALSNKGIYVSSISACHSKKEKISYVVEELKHDKKLAMNTVRVSFSSDNNEEEISLFIKELQTIVGEIRND